MFNITYSERIKIEIFCELGLSNIQMGDRLHRSPSTISYELSRCKPYQAEFAQADAEYKRPRCGRKTKLSDELKQKILNYLHLSWSPEMIAHEFKLGTKSIYNWLNQGSIDFSLNDLPEHCVRQRSKYNQSLGRSIEQRPTVVVVSSENYAIGANHVTLKHMVNIVVRFQSHIRFMNDHWKLNSGLKLATGKLIRL